MSEAGPQDTRWHLDRKVPISLLVTMVAQFAVGMIFVFNLRKDVDAIQQREAVRDLAQHDRDERQDKLVADNIVLLRAQMDRIEGYVYRLTEKAR